MFSTLSQSLHSHFQYTPLINNAFVKMIYFHRANRDLFPRRFKHEGCCHCKGPKLSMERRKKIHFVLNHKSLLNVQLISIIPFLTCVNFLYNIAFRIKFFHKTRLARGQADEKPLDSAKTHIYIHTCIHVQTSIYSSLVYARQTSANA